MTTEPWRQTAATLGARPLGRISSPRGPIVPVAGLLAVAASAYAGEGWSYGLPATDAATCLGAKLPSLGPGPAVLGVADEATAFEDLEREVAIGQLLHATLRMSSPSGVAAAEHYAAQVEDARVALASRTAAPAAQARWLAQQLAILRGSLLESLEVYGDWLAAMRALNPNAERFEIPDRYIARARDAAPEVSDLADLEAAVRVEDWLAGG